MEKELDSEAKNVVLDTATHAKLVELLSRRTASTLSIVVTVVGAAIAAYYMRSVGMSLTTALVVGIFSGGTLGLLTDVVRFRIRMVQALDLLQGAKNDG